MESDLTHGKASDETLSPANAEDIPGGQGVRILDIHKGSWGLRELQLRVTPVGTIHFVWGQAKFSEFILK